MAKKDPEALEVIMDVNISGIESFNAQSQQDSNWGTILRPFEAQHFVKNEAGDKSWYHILKAGQKMTFHILSDKNSSLWIEYIRLNLIGGIEYTIQSPRDKWSDILDIEKTDGAIGENGSFYLGRTTAGAVDFEMVASSNLKDRSPNLTYSIMFSFIDGINGLIRYCKIDPLLKTSSIQH